MFSSVIIMLRLVSCSLMSWDLIFYKSYSVFKDPMTCYVIIARYMVLGEAAGGTGISG